MVVAASHSDDDDDTDAPATAAAVPTASPTPGLTVPSCPLPIPSKALTTETGCANSSCAHQGFGERGTTTLMRCPCRQVLYCGRACQESDWVQHRAACRSVRLDQDLVWLKEAQDAENRKKRPDMRGIDFVPSKNLDCKRYITIRPGVRYFIFFFLFALFVL